MWQLLSGVFLGWSLGSNDASNVFGTAVASRMVRFWTAAILCSLFVIVGAVLEGREGMHTYQQLSSTNVSGAFAVTFAAAVTVTMMSIIGLPVSTSQAVVGGLVCVGFQAGTLNTTALTKVVICWIATPIGAAIITMVLYELLGKLMLWLSPNLFQYDRWLRIGLIIAGSYGAYALGANNVANVTGPFTGPGGMSPLEATVVGGVAIALGVLTYSRNVMLTVGKDLVKLDAFTALVTILGQAITVHLFAKIGVPVSTSQAIVGAVLGVGLLKGVKSINRLTFVKIGFGWIGTPLIAAAFTYFTLLISS